MTVVSVDKNTEALSLTVVAEFDAGVQRVWKIWEDPRQLERWWGAPTVPATFETHDFTPGGKAAYYMTVPDGTKAHGWWQFTSINAPDHLEFDYGFADDQGTPMGEHGAAHATVKLEPIGDRTRMTMSTRFDSEEQLQMMSDMGMEEGLREAIGQVDALLAEPANASRQ
ncbi:activator of HSP90 ATPase [Arthrobacter sp. StoSoilA2]|uniref:SRPBCC family protein n=1 Tax=Arthrobacter sp. StoSoilA2 TaxID=2830990 RepID=UPI001CC81E9B|nr:SRPBCC domain-containing protein [Arthrobacter sp. StoSoilA2]BCW37664.1 activator of HSP90 ATPase [Arthrobacter sp. StoSoilA2]